MDTDFHNVIDEFGQVVNKAKPILIGDKVWIGCRSMILKGAIIPNSCVVGAGSIVSKALDRSNCLYAGTPCKIIKENISWEP
jgi:acetyltransferase-like isoleucine patch superfamily enzyme